MTAEDARKIAEQNGRPERERRAYEYFDEQIKRAAMGGYRKMFFSFDGGYLDKETNQWISGRDTHITREEGREHYSKLGFRFEHVGIIGGVMQARDQENIVW